MPQPPRTPPNSPLPKAKVPRRQRLKTDAPLPQGASRQELAQDILAELKLIGCYFGAINANWGARSQLALDRFDRLAATLELPLDEPQPASLDAWRGWKGARSRKQSLRASSSIR